jgi:hypothetical protein
MIWGPSGVGKRHFVKGGLISERFSLWLQSPNKADCYSPKEITGLAKKLKI